MIYRGMWPIACEYCGNGTHVHLNDMSSKDVTLYRHRSGLVLHGYCKRQWLDSLPPEIDRDVIIRIIARAWDP